MKTILLIRKPEVACFFLILFLSMGLITLAEANKMNEGSDTSTPMAHDEQAMMSKWLEYGTPGENHKVLNALIGRWDYQVKWWIDPKGDPEVSTGINNNKWLMGGRYLQLSTRGISMGQPFEGMGLIGFDNSRKKYQSIWIDNMGTGIMKAESTYNPENSLFTEHGTFSDPLFGETSFRGEIKLIDKDHYNYKMYTIHKKGQEFLSLDIDYTRSK